MCTLTLIETDKEKQVAVADIKKEYILNIIHASKLCKSISKIILFGSSIENRCTPDSDIDIAVFGDKTKAQMFKSKDYRAFVNAVCSYGDLQDYDILYFKTNAKYNAAILDDIAQGTVLYERS